MQKEQICEEYKHINSTIVGTAEIHGTPRKID